MNANTISNISHFTTFCTGLRAATATVVPLLIGYVLQVPAMDWASLAGFSTALVDRGGAYQRRALAMGLFVLDLHRRVHGWPVNGGELHDIGQFLSLPGSWMVVVDLLIMVFALCFFFLRAAQDHDRAEARAAALTRR